MIFVVMVGKYNPFGKISYFEISQNKISHYETFDDEIWTGHTYWTNNTFLSDEFSQAFPDLERI